MADFFESDNHQSLKEAKLAEADKQGRESHSSNKQWFWIFKLKKKNNPFYPCCVYLTMCIYIYW